MPCWRKASTHAFRGIAYSAGKVAWNAGSASQRCGERIEARMAARRQDLGIGHPDVADHAGRGDLRLVEAVAGGPGLGGERGDGACALGAAALDPLGPAERCGPDHALVGGGTDLVDRAGGECDQAQRPPPLRARRRHQRPPGPDLLIEPVEDRRRIDQHLAAVQHERGDAAERVDLPHRIEIAEHRARVVLVGEAERAQRHRDPAHVGRIVLADQDHGADPTRSPSTLTDIMRSVTANGGAGGLRPGRTAELLH